MPERLLIDEWPPGAGGELHEYTAAGGIVVHRERVLVVRRGADEYRLPKGHVEPGETSEQTALREVREEAGALATVLAELGTVENRFALPRDNTLGEPPGRRVRRDVVWYLMSVAAQSLGPHEEKWTPLWLGFDEALDRLRFEAERVPLRWARRVTSRR